jgi:hypothetical protein
MDAEIFVHKNVAQTHDVLPRHGRIASLDFGTQPANRLSNSREPLSDRVAQRVVGHEVGFCSAGNRFGNPVEGFQNVVQPLVVTPHISGGLRRARRTGSAASMRV